VTPVLSVGRMAPHQVTHYSTTVRSLSDDGPMGSFWAGESHFEEYTRTAFPSEGSPASMNVGFHFVARPGTWFLFHRE
jgi:hypothetical protein